MNHEFSIVGKRIPQPDAVQKVTGTARFSADVKLPGMLYARILRSKYAHAKVKSIDTSRAEALPGVKAVITAADVPDKPFFTYAPRVGTISTPILDRHILEKRARHMGDCIGAVAATDRWTAEEAVELLGVEYERLPEVFDIEEAMEPGAPRIDDVAEDNLAINAPYDLPEGDVDKGLAESDVVVEEIFTTKPQEHAALEPFACVADWDSGGRLTVYSPVQFAHRARKALSELFDLPLGNIRVIDSFTGGSFGKRLPMFTEPIAAALSMKTGKPVNLEYTMEEEFATLSVRPGMKYTIRAGFRKDGTFHALDIDAFGNAGAYRGSGAIIVALALNWGLGAYRVPNRRGRARSVFTNCQGAGCMRGLGNPEIMFGMEQVMDEAARKLGMDPIELRLKNIRKVGEPGNLGIPLQSTAQEECIKVGAERIRFREKRKAGKEGKIRRGIGMATASYCSNSYPTLLEHSSAFIKFNEDGTVTLIAHPGSGGSGCNGVVCQIAAETLGIPAEDVTLVRGDTAVTGFEVGTMASRSTYSIGSTVMHAALEAKKQLLKRAAAMLNIPADELDVKDSFVFRKRNPGEKTPLSEVCEYAYITGGEDVGSIYGRGKWYPTTNAPPFAAWFSEVDVDTETGDAKLVKCLIAGDVGRPINPMTVEGHFEGCIQMYAGYALTEDWCINKETGVLETDSFATYKVLSQLDMPETEVLLMENPDPTGPYGAKGAGELGAAGVASSIANAIYDAVGVKMNSLPITPEKIMKALNAG
ncbi:MAG: molybdopterin-dependent oxidoreductase [Deltaproteobacteria bacterium]|nr:molybdopterin-dependent oxidoreductase [Deltaproteobacteria bacterium]